MVLSRLQHRGSSLTTSVRPRAEKDWENTGGQVGLDGGHRLPEAGLLGSDAFLGGFLLTGSSHPATGFRRLASLLTSKLNPTLRWSPRFCACLGPKGDERRSYRCRKDHTHPRPPIVSFCPVPSGRHTQRPASECFRAGRAPQVSQVGTKALGGEGTQGHLVS